MSDEGYCPDMDVQGGVTACLDKTFGRVRVTVDETLLVVVAEHGAHPHDILAAGMYAGEQTVGREPCDYYGDEEIGGTKDALILVYPRILPVVDLDLRMTGYQTTGVPM